MSELLAAARAAWPGVDVPEDELRAYVEARRPAGNASVNVTDLYLACACVRGDAVALAAFEKRCLANLVAALVRHDLPRAVAEDAVQNVREKLLVGTSSKIADYQGAGGLAGWVKVIAMREALQVLRKERPAAADDREIADVVPIDTASPELAHFRRLYLDEFQRALVAALSELPRRDRNLLRQQYVYRMTIDQIGAIYGVHRVTASRWEVKARTTLLAGTRKRLMQRLAIDAAELESIMRIIQSQLDVSLLRYLGEDAPDDKFFD